VSGGLSASRRRSWPEACSAPAALVSSRRQRNVDVRRPQVAPTSARASGRLLVRSGTHSTWGQVFNLSKDLPGLGSRRLKTCGHVATGHGQPRAKRPPCIPQVENLRPLSENLRPLSENLRPLSENLRPLSESCGHVATGMGSPEPGERARLMRDLSHGRARGTGRRSARADSRPLRCRSPARRGGGPPACRGRGRRPRALRPR
jgi:hypothetical protein